MKHLVILIFGALFPLTQDAPEVRIYSGAWFPPNLTLSADANLVEMAATVRDRHEHLIGGLKAADFEVLDNNHPREITIFEERRSAGNTGAGAKGAGDSSPAPQPAPRTIALFFDDAHGNLLGMHKSVEAAEKLISNNLQAGDRVGIFTASGAVSVDFTDDRDALLAALSQIIPRPLSGTTAVTECPELNAWEAYAIIQHVDPGLELVKMQEAAACVCPAPVTPACRGEQRIPVQTKAEMVWVLQKFRSTTTLDAIGIVMRHLAAEPNKRILILMTPAFPAEKGMESETNALLNAALRANIQVSTLKVLGTGVPMGVAREEFMGQAAKATGGQIVDGYYDPTASLRDLVTEPEVTYLLGFSNGDPDGLTHVLKVRLRANRGYNVESRTRYFAAKAPVKNAQKHIDGVAMSSDIVKDFPATVNLRQDHDGIAVTIAVDAKGLQFPEKEGRRIEELTLLTVLEDAGGNFIAGKQSVMDLALTPATLAEKVQKGIQAATSFAIPHAGTYRVREVIREAVQDHIWASTLAISIP